MSSPPTRRTMVGAIALAVLLAASLAIPGFAGTPETLVIGDAGTSPTAVSIGYSQAAFADGGATVALIARDDLFADALASGALQTGRPLLLNPGDALDDAVSTELSRLGVTEVLILGGEEAIAPAVENTLVDNGLTVRRIAGDTRLDTAAAVAAELPEATTALLVRAFDGGNGDATQAFADALTVGTWAAQEGIPVLLTDTAGLSDATSTYLQASSITDVVVVGGTSAVSDQVMTDLGTLSITARRVSGANRFETATAVLADRGITEAPVVLVVEGQASNAWTLGFPAAAYADSTDAAMLLSNGDALPTATQAWLASQADTTTLVCAASTAACNEASTLLAEGSGDLIAPDLTSVWILGDGATSDIVDAGSPVNVTEVGTEEVDGSTYLRVVSSGLPDYTSVIDQDQYDSLTTRPNVATDFDDGAPSVAVGDTVTWGQDIGYVNDQCDVGAGQGYWPPGPACPTTQDTEAFFPLTPIMAADGEESETGLGKLGLWVNGVSIYGWGDGGSYDDGGVWQALAPVFEVYDLDICDGHAAMGDYHHHNDADCLAEELQDTGDNHSPVYGVAADGFPVYGPWVAAGVLARSSWAVRGLDDAGSATGCGEAGARTCLMVDRTDPSAGTVAATQDGPGTADLVTTMSGNVLTAVAGSYFEDYYYDATLDDGSLQALDEHNGHEHDGLGYHYHVTLQEQSDGHLANVFPYFIGETFAGELADNAVAQAGGVGPPPGGGPGGGPPPGAGS